MPRNERVIETIPVTILRDKPNGEIAGTRGICRVVQLMLDTAEPYLIQFSPVSNVTVPDWEYGEQALKDAKFEELGGETEKRTVFFLNFGSRIYIDYPAYRYCFGKFAEAVKNRR